MGGSLGSPLAPCGPHPQASPWRPEWVLAESRELWKEAEEAVAEAPSPPLGPRPANAGGAAGRLLSPVCPPFSLAGPTARTPATRGPSAAPARPPRPSVEGLTGGCAARRRGRIAGRLEWSLAVPAAAHGLNIPGKVSGSSRPDTLVHRWEKVTGGTRSPVRRRPREHPLRALCHLPGGAGSVGRRACPRRAPPDGLAPSASPPALPQLVPGRRGHGRRVLPSPGTKVLRKRQMTATGKGM